ncbi:Non-classical phosphatidylinositol transfer protein (PITP) [Thelotrema lepadinum]|nr:Non-classical phosphatidylinositol transfer protein (PITP) [Thelotrema lepadinum]
MTEHPTPTQPEPTPTSTTTAAEPIEEKAPEAYSADSSAGPVWPTLSASHPITKLRSKLPFLLEESSHSEVYGIDLTTPSDFQRNLILQKFLRANANDVDKASTQLLQTLKWRHSFQPLKTLDETFSAARFGRLGYVIRLKDVPDTPNKEKGDVATFNIYSAVKDPKLTFEDIDGFMRWRVALMELSLRELDLPSATVPIPDYGQGPDPYQALQVHDYLQVSFLRQNAHTKAASKKAIEVFREYYPETLSRKFFVNVPVVMGWMFSAVSLMLSKETVRKFTVLSYGEYLKGSLGEDVPEVYGGKGKKLVDRAIVANLDKEDQ